MLLRLSGHTSSVPLIVTSFVFIMSLAVAPMGLTAVFLVVVPSVLTAVLRVVIPLAAVSLLVTCGALVL